MVMNYDYMVVMKEVNIAELKMRLSHYLRLVRQGGGLLVRDRNRIVARIEPVTDPASLPAGERRRIAELHAHGVLRRPHHRLTRKWIEAAPRFDVDVVAALLSEREESR
jgi:antitoxin (DNA-binding transcriptional repressor) of toxin-antitoxin stability system